MSQRHLKLQKPMRARARRKMKKKSSSSFDFFFSFLGSAVFLSKYKTLNKRREEKEEIVEHV